MNFSPLSILFEFYPEDTPLRRLLLKHSLQVCDKALELSRRRRLPLEEEVITAAALLHDIGISACHAPGILCTGKEHYLRHGLLGAQMLREYGAAHHLELGPYAEVCLRHTGTGITNEQIQERKLPLPPGDYLPRTLLEKLICFADKFYSKSGDMQEKDYATVCRETAKFGAEALRRLDLLRQEVGAELPDTVSPPPSEAQ